MSDKPASETGRLDDIASRSTYSAGVSGAMIAHTFKVFRPYLQGETTLEIGPAEGLMTDLLAELPQKLTVVEGAANFCEAIQARHPDVDVVNALVEKFEPAGRFDNIVLGHVLEHVEDPVAALQRIHSWLNGSGRLLVAVPNSRSLHRQAAVAMGLLDFEEQLNDADRKHGHRRVYNPETFRRDVLTAGFEIEKFGGYWLKPVSNAQIEASWTADMIDAFMSLGERYPDIAAEIVIVARPA
jgi:2-polyprenyl-3-methyl-5-hydroxy-6-metoxy-1,4-benzoquinol methylase